MAMCEFLSSISTRLTEGKSFASSCRNALSSSSNLSSSLSTVDLLRKSPAITETTNLAFSPNVIARIRRARTARESRSRNANRAPTSLAASAAAIISAPTWVPYSLAILRWT